MMHSDEPNEIIIALDCIGQFDTAKGKYKILVVTVKIERIKE